MTAPETSPPGAERTIFLFGDVTDSWVDGLDQLYKQSASVPWLKEFLAKMTGAVTAEARAATMDRSLRASLGHFSSLQELGERYRHTPDRFGLVQAILLHTVKSGTLLQWVKREPELVGPDASTEWIGLSGGLLSVSTLAIAHDFDTLYDASIEAARLVLRVAKLASVKSRAMEAEPGTWGWTVLGISPVDLREALEQFQRANGIQPRRAQVAVVGSGWSSLIGPPSLLKTFLAQHPAVKALPKNPLTIHAGQHALAITAADLDYMVGGNSSFLDKPVRCPQHRLWGMETPGASYANWGELLRDVCAQVLSRQLDMPHIMGQVNAKLGPEVGAVRILQPGASSHAPYLASVLEQAGRRVSVHDESALVEADGGEGTSLKPGRIAIVGMAGRGPGSDNVDEFWEAIMAKRDLCSEVPKDRFDIDEYYCEAHERGDQRCRMRVRHGCFMDKPGHFDARFFHISPREALLMDPNHRQFLTSTYEALESAGYSDGRWPHSFTCLDDAGILSPTGNCKTFRDDADGYCRGDFVGAVVLKRLEDAVAHNDRILAVVAASGRNHSGNSTSITTSDAAAQERLFRRVLLKAQLTPDDVSYVEMHGTGTQTGDPAELNAVAKTFEHRRRANGPLPVGGIKANFGHSEAAAGMAELLKSIKMFQTSTIPPQAGMPHALNPKFPSLAAINIEIPSEPRPFVSNGSRPRRILLNNFDAAGGNACLLLEDFAPAAGSSQRQPDPRPSHVFATSARTKAAYLQNKRNLAAWLRANPAARIEDVAYTTTARRMHHPFRFACSATSAQQVISRLEAEADDMPSSASPASQPVVFVFTGQGSHYAGMAAELYHTSPVFRETADMCAALCAANAFPEFLDIIIDAAADVDTKNTAQIQLAVVTLELALTAFWRSTGIEPAMVVGHSLGEYAALHAAGVLSLADTLSLVGSRALMLLERCEADACSMLSVTASVSAVRDCLARLPSTSCSVACINGPSATVVSGTAEDLAQFQTHITAQDATVRARPLSVPFAFHSFQVDPILADYTSLAGSVTYLPPKVPVASTLLGSIVEGPGIFNPEYLARQTRQPVNFVGALTAIATKLRDPVWLEVGPAPVCLSFVRSTLTPPPAKTLHSIEARTSNWASVSKAISSAYVSGVDIDWLAFHAPFERNLDLLTLPAYAWDMKDFWVTYSDKDKLLAGVPEGTPQAALPEPPLSTCAQYLVKKSSSPKIEVTFRASISDPAFLALIDNHKMQQVGLCSGSVFCDAALTVAKYALEYSGRKDVPKRSLTVHEPELLAPLTRDLVGIHGELHTTAVIENPSANIVMVSFKATSAQKSHDLGTMRVQVNDPEKLQADWDRMAYFVKTQMEARIRDSKEGLGHRLQPEVLYALFSKNVEFGPAFKRIQEGYIARDYQEAAASVVLEQDPAGSGFTFSPYWGEALAHLAGFLVNGNPNSDPRTTFIVMGFSGVEQTVDFVPGKEYLTYTRISRWEGTTAFCDAYVFDAESSKLVMICSDLRYQQLPRAVWKSILEGGHAGSSHKAPAEATKNSPAKKTKTNDAVVHVAPIENHASTAQEAEEVTDSRVLEIILESIVKATGTDPSEFRSDTILADLGVDSIMTIEIVSAVRDKTGVDLPAQFAFEYPTIGDLRLEFGGLPGTPEGPEASETGSSSIFTSSSTSIIEKADADLAIPQSSSPSDSAVLVEPKEVKTKPQKVQPIDDRSPLPNTRITLLQGRPGPNKTPFYMMADGTGSIATYIHLPVFKGGRPIYGVDSPFLRCPSRLTPEIGIDGVAKLVVESLVKHHPKGNFIIGGFSAGSTVAYEVARQLPGVGRKVDGLLVIDLCCPRPDIGLLDEDTVNHETDVGITIFGAAAAVDNLWTSTGSTRDHLCAYLFAMRNYHPPPMTVNEQPSASAVIWAEKGMVNRVKDDPKAMKLLVDSGIPIEAYPGYMEDPKNGPFACFIPDKTEADLGPNGWDRYVGDILCLSMDADHLDMPMPGHVHLLHEQMTRVLGHFDSSSR
ncbi:conidial yellow pigment biosynthesis polyketide synthase [Corynespora cassiicola Philippines]|uniref:Conidial yellow pigment biosynthesis polyketide synthase n=1 Tax=Corynespora cassiicola Philippines TaxID=1448308 RepID=A0A2T2NSP9_CORCC|nr:conidial yellow pigment biosynthesis polyketide synthase [Corynespora cassiicola Philippines]